MVTAEKFPMQCTDDDRAFCPHDLYSMVCKHAVFYNKFVAEGDGVEYSDATLSAFVEAPDVARVYEVAAGGPVRERIAKLRAMRPIAP